MKSHIELFTDMLIQLKKHKFDSLQAFLQPYFEQQLTEDDIADMILDKTNWPATKAIVKELHERGYTLKQIYTLLYLTDSPVREHLKTLYKVKDTFICPAFTRWQQIR